MLVQQKKGNIINAEVGKKIIDYLPLEWYETSKRILHKRTTAGTDITLRFLKENQQLTEGDILFEDDTTIIAVEILPCDAISVKPKTAMDIAAICYEIGNKHLPLFFYNNELLIAFEWPLYNVLLVAGYDVERVNKKLLNPLKTSVTAHPQLSNAILFGNNTAENNL